MPLREFAGVDSLPSCRRSRISRPTPRDVSGDSDLLCFVATAVLRPPGRHSIAWHPRATRQVGCFSSRRSPFAAMGRGQGRGRSAGAQNDQNLSGDDLGPLGDTQVLAEQTPAPKRSRTAGNSPQQSVKKLNTGGGSAARGTSADSLGGESVPAQKRAPRGRHVYKCLKCKVQNNHNPQLVFISRVACEKCNGVYMDHLTQHGT